MPHAWQARDCSGATCGLPWRAACLPCAQTACLICHGRLVAAAAHWTTPTGASLASLRPMSLLRGAPSAQIERAADAVPPLLLAASLLPALTGSCCGCRACSWFCALCLAAHYSPSLPCSHPLPRSHATCQQTLEGTDAGGGPLRPFASARLTAAGEPHSWDRTSLLQLPSLLPLECVAPCGRLVMFNPKPDPAHPERVARPYLQCRSARLSQ